MMLQVEPKWHPWQLVMQFMISQYIVRVIRKAVRVMAEASGADVSEAQDIELAVGEALANVYNHAHAQTPDRTIVKLRAEGSSIEILVEHEGSGLHPNVTIPAALPASRQAGRGLYLMDQLMDTMEIFRPKGTEPGTAVRMMKRLAYTHVG